MVGAAARPRAVVVCATATKTRLWRVGGEGERVAFEASAVQERWRVDRIEKKTRMKVVCP